jgi:hypothetical protein
MGEVMGGRPNGANRSFRSMSDGDLALALADLGPRLVLPPDPGAPFAAAVRSRIEAEERGAAVIPLTRRSRPRSLRMSSAVDRVRWLPPVRRALVLVAVLVLLGAVAAGAATLGVRGVQIIFGPPPTPSAGPTTRPAPLGASLLAGLPVSLSEAQASVDWHIVVPTEPGLGRPQVFLDQGYPGGLVTLVYPAGPELPAIGGGRIGMTIMEFQAQIERRLLDKFVVSGGTTVTGVDVGGVPGFWVAGAPHEIAFVGPDGLPRLTTLRLSGDALLWERDGLTIRMESELDQGAAVRIAESVR